MPRNWRLSLAALGAILVAGPAEASLTRQTSSRETPALALSLRAPERSEFSLFDGTELARALASRPALISISTDEEPASVRTRFVSPSELSTDELPEGPELVPITGVREQRFNLQLPPNVFGLEPLRGPPGDEASYPKTRYRVFGLLGTPILGELRGVSLELQWGSGEFRAGLASGTVGWLSQDPMEDRDSPNLYGFVGARPHEMTDPLGLAVSVSKDGTFVISDERSGRGKTYRVPYSWAESNKVALLRTLVGAGGMLPVDAMNLMGQQGVGIALNSPDTAGALAVQMELVDAALTEIEKAYAVVAVGAVTAGAGTAVLGTGFAATSVSTFAGGVAAQGTSDVLNGQFSGVDSYLTAGATSTAGGWVINGIASGVSRFTTPEFGGLNLPQSSAAPKPSNTTRLGVTRRNPTDWRRFRDLVDEMGVGDMLSPANRRIIAGGRRAPVVDAAWQAHFPDTKLGEPLTMHHLGGYPLTVPLTRGQHFDAHMPGGYAQNPGGPGANVPEEYLVQPRR